MAKQHKATITQLVIGYITMFAAGMVFNSGLLKTMALLEEQVPLMQLLPALLQTIGGLLLASVSLNQFSLWILAQNKEGWERLVQWLGCFSLLLFAFGFTGNGMVPPVKGGPETPLSSHPYLMMMYAGLALGLIWALGRSLSAVLGRKPQVKPKDWPD